MAHGRVPLDDVPFDFRGGMKKWAEVVEARDPRGMPCVYSRELNACMMACLEMRARKRVTSLELVGLVGRVRPGC